MEADRRLTHKISVRGSGGTRHEAGTPGGELLDEQRRRPLVSLGDLVGIDAQGHCSAAAVAKAAGGGAQVDTGGEELVAL